MIVRMKVGERRPWQWISEGRVYCRGLVAEKENIENRSGENEV